MAIAFLSFDEFPPPRIVYFAGLSPSGERQICTPESFACNGLIIRVPEPFLGGGWGANIGLVRPREPCGCRRIRETVRQFRQSF